MRSSTILEGSRRDEISRLISGSFSHHSAEYLAHMIASPAASRQLVISTTEARLCAPFASGLGLRGLRHCSTGQNLGPLTSCYLPLTSELADFSSLPKIRASAGANSDVHGSSRGD